MDGLTLAESITYDRKRTENAFALSVLSFFRNTCDDHPNEDAPKIIVIRANIIGIVITHMVCEIIVMLAPVSGFPP